MEATATLKYLKMSPQKVRLVVDLVRGKKVEEALQILRFTKKTCAKDLEKLVRSAVANAEGKEANLDTDANRRLVTEFLEGLAKGQAVSPTFRDALETQKVCDAVLPK